MPRKTITADLKYRGEPRNILVFMDGTWNDENGLDTEGAVTNIYRLFRALAGTHDDRDLPHKMAHQNQIGLYFRGIGNDEDNKTKRSRFFGGVFGSGEKAIRDHAYVRIVEHYRKGDRIFIFGFSRGAACARLLSTKLQKYGIPASLTMEYGKEVNNNTGKSETQFYKYTDKARNKLDVKVSFLGLFDTVGAFGIPVNLGPLKTQRINLFRDLSVSECVETGVHMVAIDESREPFVPTLVNRRRGFKFEEVWFPGVHADVGGGNLEATLSKISATYMVKKLNAATVNNPIAFDEARLQEATAHTLEADNVLLHHHGDGTAKSPRELQVLKDGEPVDVKVKVHSSARQLMDLPHIRLAEEFSSYIRAPYIIYQPKHLIAMMARNKVEFVD